MAVVVVVKIQSGLYMAGALKGGIISFFRQEGGVSLGNSSLVTTWQVYSQTPAGDSASKHPNERKSSRITRMMLRRSAFLLVMLLTSGSKRKSRQRGTWPGAAPEVRLRLHRKVETKTVVCLSRRESRFAK